MIKASHPSLATFSGRDSRYEDRLSISSVSNGKIGYPPQYIESYESHISSARAIERHLLQRGLMGLVGSPVRNGQSEGAERPDSGATIDDVEDDYEPELEALVDEASVGEEATIPALSALGPGMTDDDNPLIIPNGYPQTADSPPFITEEGEEMLKYTIYDQQQDGIRNVIGTLTTVRGIPLRELRPALSQLAKDDSFRFHNDRTSLDVKNENLAIDRIFKNKVLVIRFPNRASSYPDVPVPEARNSAEIAQNDERLRIAMEEDIERDSDVALEPRDLSERIDHVGAVRPQSHGRDHVSHTDDPAFPDDDDEAPEVNSPPIAKVSSSGNSSTHSAERGPSSTRSGGSYVGPLGLCHRPECNNAARVKCVSCGQVAYCSSKCLRLDAPRHRSSCYREYNDFFASLPRTASALGEE
ncbi:uncharacterized protein LOC114828068 [Galendromus occidentalis]|uniref:Uncharacterized protein LOC114828068 n=1 Tax=Galendromus occidentalis TaxID=34638 RepID=A0AAJ7SEE9_9ACAR|nr:uncharacterized protein LOC114828068 [Galendromus occidentalis]